MQGTRRCNGQARRGRPQPATGAPPAFPSTASLWPRFSFPRGQVLGLHLARPHLTVGAHARRLPFLGLHPHGLHRLRGLRRSGQGQPGDALRRERDREPEHQQQDRDPAVGERLPRQELLDRDQGGDEAPSSRGSSRRARTAPPSAPSSSRRTSRRARPPSAGRPAARAASAASGTSNGLRQVPQADVLQRGELVDGRREDDPAGEVGAGVVPGEERPRSTALPSWKIP